MGQPARCFADADLGSLSDEEAFAVLEPYADAIRDEYLKYGLTKIKRTRIAISAEMHDTPRHFAACKDDGSKIFFAPELANAPDGVVLAVIAHEFGHAADFLYPGEFVLGQGGPALRRDPKSVEEKQWSKWLKAWHKRDDDVVELTADAIAERVMRVPYGYLGPCHIQSFDAVLPRPRGLR